jgi:hypothetical protein
MTYQLDKISSKACEKLKLDLDLSEGLNLRVKDIDFAQQQIIVRDTKGNESRVTW